MIFSGVLVGIVPLSGVLSMLPPSVSLSGGLGERSNPSVLLQIPWV